MKILAIDTSSKICSVSILEDKTVLIEKNSDDEKTHSQKLMPLIDNIFKESNLSLNDINLLACCLGPGSFTGIRIGISTVKAFADAKNIPTVGVSSLESLAYNIKQSGYIATLIDAKNNNVYFALFNLVNGTYNLEKEYTSDNINNILDSLSNYTSTPITFVGDGSLLHKDLINSKFANSIFPSQELNLQTSISIGKSAFDKFNLGIYGDSNFISPLYLKKSQAERALDGEK